MDYCSLVHNQLTLCSTQLEFIKAPLETISYVCLDPADNSVFSLIIRTNDTISSKGLRLHAFVGHPQTVSHKSYYTHNHMHIVK